MAHVLASSGLARGFGFAKGLVLAALLTPDEYGVSTLVAMVVAYAQFADLGLGAAASRDISSAVGRADQVGATRAARHLTAFKIAGAALVALVALAWSFHSGDDARTRLGLRVAALVALFSSVLAIALLRWQAEGRARLMARGSFVQSALDALLCIVLTARFGLHGLLAALLLSPLFAAAWAARSGGLTPPGLPSAETTRGYLAVGLPWLVLGILEHNLVYVDHLLVIALFGVPALGIYNIALVVSELVRMLGLTVGIVVGPRLVQRYAAHGGSVEAVREITLAPVQVLAACLPFVVPPVCFGAQAGLVQFYPRYAAAVPLLPVLLLGAQLLALNNGASLFLFALGKQGRAALLTGATVAFDVVLARWLAGRGMGLPSVAWAALAASALFTACHLTYVSLHFRFTPRGRLGFLAGVLAPSVYLSLVLSLVPRWIPDPTQPGGAVASVALSFLLLIPVGILGHRRVKDLRGVEQPPLEPAA